MAATIFRRLSSNSNNHLLLLLHNHVKHSRTLVSNPIFQIDSSIRIPFKSTPTFLHHHIRSFSTSQEPKLEAESGQTGENPSPYPSQNPHFKHQEIEGPTVERDLSALAEETRATLDATMRSVYGLSRAAAALGLLNLGVGAWIAYATRSAPASPEAAAAMVQGVAGFAFPFSLALVLRRSLKPMHFFRKMEEQGRLQILTLSLQAFKNLNLVFARVRGSSLICVAGLSAGILYVVFSN